MKAKTFKIVSYSVIAFICAVFLALTIACGALSTLINNFLVKPIVDVDEETLNAANAAGEELSTEIEREGMVLVKNDGVLPLNKTESSKVNVFGWSSTQWVTGGSGSGQVKPNSGSNLSAETDLYKALTNYGIEYNNDLKSMYTSFQSNRPYMNTGEGALHTYNYDLSRLYEPKMSDYSETLLTDAKAYSDTAIVVIGRVSGESNDSPSVQYKGKNTKGQEGSNIDKERHYLEISTEEEELLEYVGANYGKVVVIINAVNPMELGFLDTINGLDSCLVVGGTGINAASAIPEVLYGERQAEKLDEEGEVVLDADGKPVTETVKVSPSGRLSDTYAYDFESNPSFANAGENGTNFYTGDTSKLYPMGETSGNFSTTYRYKGVAYMDYVEGIYVGYKWYETAFAEEVTIDVGDTTYDYSTEAGYRSVVQYPFGYGMTYAKDGDLTYEVTQAITKTKATDKEGRDLPGATVNVNDTIEILVTVTNNGNYPVKDVIQAYYTAPYTNGGIEKAAVNLVAFAKTQTLAPNGGKDTVRLTFEVTDMASYDAYDANKDGFKGYELEGGTYEIKLRSDSHTDLPIKNTAISPKGATIEFKVPDTNLETDPTTGLPVSNKFTGSDALDGVSIDGNGGAMTGKINYMSRADFRGTFPDKKAAARAISNEIRALNLYTSAMASDWAENNRQGYDNNTAVSPGGQNNGMLLYEKDKVTELGLKLGNPENFKNEDWDKLLDQMTYSEMSNLVLHGYTQTAAVSSLGKPLYRDYDGPSQAGSFADLIDKNTGTRGTGFPNLTVVAQTFNKTLAYGIGKAMADDATLRGARGLYAPGVNIHRSPFGGRNFEYYSEDPYLSGIMAANTIKAAKNRGVYMYLKHLALYDQESLRDSICVWVPEQALREIYLEPFKIAIDDGGATGLMSSYGRAGAVWTGGSTAILTGVLREEWDFKGCVITDYADHHNFMNGDQMVRAGGDLWMDGAGYNGTFQQETTSNAFRQALRQSAKHVLYMVLNAEYTALNPVDTDETTIITTSRPGFPWWIPVLVAVDVVAFGGCGVWLFFAIKKKGPEGAPAVESVGAASAGGGNDDEAI